MRADIIKHEIHSQEITGTDIAHDFRFAQLGDQSTALALPIFNRVFLPKIKFEIQIFCEFVAGPALFMQELVPAYLTYCSVKIPYLC